jgi:hypothetical protein
MEFLSQSQEEKDVHRRLSTGTDTIDLLKLIA